MITWVASNYSPSFALTLDFRIKSLPSVPIMRFGDKIVQVIIKYNF